MSLSGSSTAPAQSSERLRIAKRSGRRIVDLVQEKIKPSDIIGENSLRNAAMVRYSHRWFYKCYSSHPHLCQ